MYVYVCTDKTLNSNRTVEPISTKFQWNPTKNSILFNYYAQKTSMLENYRIKFVKSCKEHLETIYSNVSKLSYIIL